MAVIKIEAKKDTRCTQTVCLIQGDRRTQILRFSVNRYDGGVDLADLVWVIKTVNAKGVEDVFEPAAVEISESRITIDWLVDGTVTDASGMAKYELNGLDATVEGKAVIWKGGTGTMSLRANIGENFGEIDMTNIDRLVLYVEGRLQDIIDLTEELQGAGDAANAAAIAANAGAQRAEAAATAANAGATAATEAASNANAAADAANTAALPHAQLYGMRVRGETAKASGNPVTCLADAGSLLQPVTVLEPQQAGSGDPYPAGGGKNLLPITAKTQTINGVTFTVDNGVITVNGTATANAYLWLCDEFTLQPGTYVMSGIPENFDYNTQGGFTDDNWNINRYGVTTLTEAKKVKPYIVVRNGVTANNVIFKLQLEVGSTPTAFAPYSNIRPFIGYDKLGLVTAGKNYVSPPVNVVPGNATYTYDAVSGTFVLTKGSGSGYGQIYYKLDVDASNLVGKAMTISCESYSITSAGHDPRLYLYAQDIMTLICRVQLDSEGKSKDFTIPDGTTALYLVVRIDGYMTAPAGTVFTISGFQLELGSVASDFQPYQSNAYTVQIGQTVYGGRMDWLTGKFIVTDELRTYNGSEGWFSNSGAVDSLFAISLDATVNSVSASSHTPVVNETVPQSTIGCGYYSEYDVLYLNLTGGQKISVEDFKAKLAASPVQVAYKLAEPVEIQLTPHVISAADPEQTNTLYGDGAIETTYVKPLHVSIEERVAAALAAMIE